MEKLTRFSFLFILLFSCNVVKLATQGETKLSDEFFITDKIPFHANALSMIYKKSDGYIKSLEGLIPSTFATSSGTPSVPVFGTEWNSTPNFSDYQNNQTTAANWVKSNILVLNQGVDTQNQKESPTWKALNMMNTVCAAGILLGEQIPMGEYDYPMDGNYSVTLGVKEIKAISEYCGVKADSTMDGMLLSIVISTPPSTTIYDKTVDMMNKTFYVKYTNTSMAFAGADIYDNNNLFTKVVMSNNTNGFALSMIDGPNSNSLNLQQTQTLRIHYDSTPTNTGLAAIELRETYDSTPSSDNVFYLGGYIGSTAGIVIHMNSSNLNNKTSTYTGCLSPSNWSMLSDGADCSLHSGIAGTATNASSSVAFYNVFTDWNTNFGVNTTVNDASTPGFTSPGNMGTSGF